VPTNASYVSSGSPFYVSGATRFLVLDRRITGSTARDVLMVALIKISLEFRTTLISRSVRN
jgi:hypothetical protein